jgi:hypothetical protein
MFKTKLISAALGAGLVIGGIALAQAPKDNVSKALHPNLAAAQRLSTQAYEKITAAQEANEFDLAGHAAKAKTLLDQVNSELKLAAQQSNKNKAK